MEVQHSFVKLLYDRSLLDAVGPLLLASLSGWEAGELVRAHGLRQARYRGLPKVKLQHYFIAAACNLKRWIRREAWTLRQAVLAVAAKSLAETVN
jgi:Transposase DDE domain